jgi:hypothetical protein
MTIKTFLASFGAVFDGVNQEPEHSESATEALVREVRESAIKIRSQLNIVNSKLLHQHEMETRLIAECGQWREHALDWRELNEEKALCCVQALKQSQRALNKLHLHISENQHLAAELETHLYNVEQKLNSIEYSLANIVASSENQVAQLLAQHQQEKVREADVYAQWESRVKAAENRDESAMFSLKARLQARESYIRENRDVLICELYKLGAQSQCGIKLYKYPA